MIAQHHPTAAVELWAQDEARIGLIPITRCVWSEKGHRPTAPCRRIYEWLYIYGFVHPTSGRVEWLLLPTVSIELFQLALEHFARTMG